MMFRVHHDIVERLVLHDLYCSLLSDTYSLPTTKNQCLCASTTELPPYIGHTIEVRGAKEI